MKIAVIGAGAMGGATVEGLIKGQQFKNEDITVSDPSQAVVDKFAKTGVSVTTDNKLAAETADIVCVVVKPWLVERVLKDIKDELNPKKQILIVIAAGVKSENIKEWLGEQCPSLFLAIPNIAIAEMASMTFIVPVDASEKDTQTVVNIFDEMGHTLITDEQHLAAGTTLASCGIAYAMRYIRAASEGGVELGFKADDAKKIVMQTMKGAVELLEASGLHPEAAIDLVTTPGGVTIKGLNEMDEQLKQIGERLKGLRDVLDIPVSEMAETIGISAEKYEKIEAGELDITISNLMKIAKKYGVSTEELIFAEAPHMKSYYVTRKGQGMSIERTKAYKYQSLVGGFVNHKADVFIVTVEPKPEAHTIYKNTHPGQEFNMVLEGKMELYIGGKTMVLEEGDSIYFDSTKPHGMLAVGDKPVKFLAFTVE